MMKNDKSKLVNIFKLLIDLENILTEHSNEQNVRFYLRTIDSLKNKIKNYIDGVSSLTSSQWLELWRDYQDMFPPRDGLNEFYIIDSNSDIMSAKNQKLSFIIKELNKLLK